MGMYVTGYVQRKFSVSTDDLQSLLLHHPSGVGTNGTAFPQNS